MSQDTRGMRWGVRFMLICMVGALLTGVVLVGSVLWRP